MAASLPRGRRRRLNAHRVRELGRRGFAAAVAAASLVAADAVCARDAAPAAVAGSTAAPGAPIAPGTAPAENGPGAEPDRPGRASGGAEAAGAVAPAPIAVATTLREAVREVLARSPGLGAERARLDAARAERREAAMRSFPRLSVRSEFQRGDDPVYVFGSLLRQGSFGPGDFSVVALNHPAPLSNFAGGLEVGIPLFTAFELSSRRKAAFLGVGRSEARLQSAEQAARRRAIGLYLIVLWKRGLVDGLDRSIASSQAELESAEKLSRRGLVLGSDYEAARAVLGSLRMRRIQAGKALEGAREALAVLMGIPAETLAAGGTLAAPAYPERGESAWAAEAVGGRPELREADLAASAAEALETRAARSYLPRVEAFGDMEANSGGLSGGSSNRMFGVRASLPLGDPSYLPRRAQARADREAERLYADDLRESVRLQVLEAYTRYRGAAESLSVAEETMSRAADSLEKFRPLYREGRRSILEVLRAEEASAQAEAALLETLFSIHDGYAGLLLAAGALGDDAVRVLDANLRGPRP